MKLRTLFGSWAVAWGLIFCCSTSPAQVISIQASTNTGFAFQLVFNTPAKGEWHVQRSTDLLHWKDCVGPQGDAFWTGATLTPIVYEDAGDSNGILPMVFYRLAQVTNPPTIVGPYSFNFADYVAGTKTAVSAVMSGAEPMGAFWYRNGMLFTNGDDLEVSMILGTSNVLAGQWQVVATNAFGAATSQVATITFSPAILGAPVIVMPTLDRFVSPGSNVTFNVEATGPRPITYQWMQNGDSIVGATNALFSITNVQIHSSGYYDVLVSNAFGAVLSPSAFLTVVPPFESEELRWQFQTEGSIFSSPAVGADGTVYIGSEDFKVYALDGQTGDEIWAFETGGNVDSAPAIGGDGTVYIGSWDDNLYALDGQTGFQKWVFQTSASIYGSPAIGSDGTVYVGSLDFNVYAVDGSTGIQKWKFQTGFSIEGGAAISTNGTVYIGSGDGKVYALDGQTGGLKWQFQTGRQITADPAVGWDGTVFVGSCDQNFYALDGQTGSEKWQFQTGGYIGSSASIGGDGTIYVGSDDHNLYALDSLTGTEKWTFVTGAAVNSTPTICADGNIYVGSGDGNVYSVDAATGAGSSIFVTSSPEFSSLAVGLDGTLYFGTWNDTVCALPSQSGGLANSAWPKFHQNNQNTGLATSPTIP